MARDFGRPINRIILHCTASTLTATPEAIQRYWREQLGWRNPGYHYLIDHRGGRHILAHLSQVTNGVRGRNWDSCHISTIGGRDYDNRTDAQKRELIQLITELRSDQILGNIPIYGHNDFTSLKECPNYNVAEWLLSVGIDPMQFELQKH